MKPAYLALAALVAACVGTETENPEIGLRGRLVNVQGYAVPGTRVRATTGDPMHTVTVDSALTDEAGKFRFPGLPEGSYNLDGDYLDGTLVVFISGVRYSTGTRDIGTDTLRAPGSVSGRTLYQGLPVPGVPCYLSGTSHFAVSDSAGRFKMHRVPQRTYLLIYYTSPPYRIALDTPVVVLSGRPTELLPRELELD